MPSSELSVVYPYLPPTTNALGSQQRKRLMRSTRKVGAVLGTTPYLLESDTSFTMLPLGKATSKALKRQGSIFTHQLGSLSATSSSTSITSSHRPSPSVPSITLSQGIASDMRSTESRINPPGLHSARRHRSGEKSPQLYLQLNTVPVSPTDDCDASSPSSCASLPSTPVTPSAPDVTEVRRKRMAKLARHLGENIPTELIFVAESPTKSATIPPSRLPRHTRSVQVMPIEIPGICDHRASLGQSRQDWVGEWNRSDIKDVQKELRNLKVR